MKFKTNERGFVLAEFAIALPLLIILLYSLGLVTLSGLKIAREQVADYTLETEAQYVIERITTDARAAQSVEIKNVNNFDEIIFYCHSIGGVEGDNLQIAGDKKYLEYTQDILDPRIYAVYSAAGKVFHVYFKHSTDNTHNNPLTGDSVFGDSVVTRFEVDREKLAQKIFRFTIAMQSKVTNQVVEFTTAVYMPACESVKVPEDE